MIEGLGVDVTEIARIERLMKEYGSLFLDRVFTPSEREYCESRAHPSLHFAGRWAAKEAFYKALCPSCQAAASWQSVEIVSDADGRPSVSVRSDDLAESLRCEGIDRCHVSISHERAHCIAVVVFERRSQGD